MIGFGPPAAANPWQRLDPLTRLTVSVASLVAVVVGGILVPLAVGLVAVAFPALVAGVLGRVARTTLLVALPLALSVVLVNVLFTPGGGTVVVEAGPLRVTSEGLWTAAQVGLRVLVMGGAVVLLYVTTEPADLVSSLQAHGLPARAAFVVHAAAAAVPRLADHAARVTAAQRARGLDSEGSLSRRLRGVLAVAGPTVSGAIEEVETRALALESRAFTRPGRHTLLWVPADSSLQRLSRWAMVGAVVVLLAARLAGLATP